MKSIFTFIFAFTFNWVFAQVEKVITLDSVTIEATKRGFDVKDFVDWVQYDTTFYKAFKNLHYYPYHIQSNLFIYDKKHVLKCTQERKAIQHVSNKKRWIIIEEEKDSGKVYNRKKEYNYYTAELFDYIFFPLDTLRATNTILKKENEKNPDSKNEKYTEKLKTLMFNPGAEVEGIPLIGNRMEIFDEKRTKHYDYKILSDTLNDTIPCYVFLCKAKKGGFTQDKRQSSDQRFINMV